MTTLSIPDYKKKILQLLCNVTSLYLYTILFKNITFIGFVQQLSSESDKPLEFKIVASCISKEIVLISTCMDSLTRFRRGFEECN